jgi:Lysozyme like domain
MGRRYRSSRDGRLVISAVAAGIGLAVLSGHHGHLPAIPGAAADASGHGTLGCVGLEALWESAGGSRAAAFTAAEIAMAESSGQQYAALVNTNGTTDRGYWQINSSHGSLSTFGAYGNARAAVLISSNGADWSPWVTWQTGAYAGKC